MGLMQVVDSQPICYKVLVDSIETLTKDEATLLAQKLKIKKLEFDVQNQSQEKFLPFVRNVWPEFKEGKHHKIIAKKFEDIANGKLKRLIVNMPPRHTKSEFASFLFPAWFVGRKPRSKIMQTTHTGELAIRFGRKVRNLMDSSDYKKIFPKSFLQPDSMAAGRWETAQGGEYFAAGTGGAVTGRGADLLIIDDPHSEQDALSETALDNAYEWYTSGPRQRLQPGGAIVIVMTRWGVKDLTGKLMKAQIEPKADQWDVIEFPAILPSGKPVWPGFWSFKELEGVKASLSAAKWNAQWQQAPVSQEGAIIKKEWWQIWTESKIPEVQHIIQSYDTAFSKKETADYSAITTWGVFFPKANNVPHLILLDAKRGRWEFPDLKRMALKEYKYWEPETVIIEAKASGLPLTHELRQIGIPVVNFTPSKGSDKHVRVNSVAPLFESGMIWTPEERWAEDVIEECAAFPYGDHDDLVDSMTQAVMRFRQGNFIRLSTDYIEDKAPKVKRVYY